MSSALKPVVTPTGAQTSSVPSQLNKPMHPQSAPTTYGQPMSHVPQNLVNIPPPSNIHNPTHNIPHHINTNTHSTSHSANHYSLSIPNASQHYSLTGTNISPSSHSATSITNHPVTNVNPAHSQPVTSMINPPKNLSHSPNYQANPGNSYKPTSVQNIPLQPQAVNATSEEKHQSNGTPEKNKLEGSQNHIPGQIIKDKPQTPLPSTPPQVQTITAKITPEKIAGNNSNEQKQIPPEVNKSSDAPISLDNKSSLTSSMNSVSSVTTSSGMLVSSTTTIVSSSSVTSSTMATETVTSTLMTSAPTNSITAPPSQAVVDVELPDSQDVQDPVVTVLPTVKPKEQVIQKSTLKLATTPRTPVRKAKAAKSEVAESSKTSRSESKSSTQKSPGSGGKTKRTRTRTQPYQSPLPEVEMISKITATTPRTKNVEDKLIIFYKNEFLAVRNSDGGFYICQAMQNIYKSSPRIRIRWLSQEKNDKELYSPDFYDYTDFDCILTNLNMGRVVKGKYRLPSSERIRTDSILKRAIAVEKGDATPPPLTEEHPDGLDLSLYKEESQLKKRKSLKRKASTPIRAALKPSSVTKSPEQPKVRKMVPKPQPVKKSVVLKRALSAKIRKVDSKESGRAERAAKRRSPEPVKNNPKPVPVIDLKKAKVLAKVARKAAPKTPPKLQPPQKQHGKSSKQQAVSSKKIVTKKEKAIITRKSKRGKK